ncbi:hypothetical protein MRX96_001528 [Rhipicephalus microplus]
MQPTQFSELVAAQTMPPFRWPHGASPQGWKKPSLKAVGCRVLRPKSALFWLEGVVSIHDQLQSIKGHLFHSFPAVEVSLLLRQLKPPIRVVLVAYQETNKKKADYIGFTSSGDLDADKTVAKLRQYAGETPSVQKCDLVVLITTSRLIDVSAYVGAPEMLGIAPLEGICSQYSVAVVKDLAGRYTGIHSTAHEMGHSFGSYHDGEGTSTKCPAADGYLMSPRSNGRHIEEFSSCSLAVISKYIRSDTNPERLVSVPLPLVGRAADGCSARRPCERMSHFST